MVGGTTTILSSGFDDMSMTRAVDTAEVTTFGDADRVYVAGLKDGTWSVSGPFASTIETIVGQYLGSTVDVTVQYSPNTTAAGQPIYSASAFLTSFDVDSSVDGRVNMSMTWQRSGALTTGTH